MMNKEQTEAITDHLVAINHSLQVLTQAVLDLAERVGALDEDLPELWSPER